MLSHAPKRYILILSYFCAKTQGIEKASVSESDWVEAEGLKFITSSSGLQMRCMVQWTFRAEELFGKRLRDLAMKNEHGSTRIKTFT